MSYVITEYSIVTNNTYTVSVCMCVHVCMVCYVMLCYVMLCYVMLCYGMYVCVCIPAERERERDKLGLSCLT